MTKLALLNNVDHKDLKVITERSAKYGDNVMLTMTYPFEFRDIQAYYPILFHRDEGGALYPVALFGFQQGENLFLDESGWHARYVPAMIRRQPFLIGFQRSQAQGAAEEARMMSIDLDHPRVNKEIGEPLFQPLGGRTPYLEEAANLLETVYHGHEQNNEFIGMLQENKLIESVTLDIALKDGSRNQLLGFYSIDEERLQTLSGSSLESLSKKGFLMPLFMILASMSNIRTLVELKNQRL